MFEYWLEVDVGASWNKLINALEEIRQTSVVSNIRQNILKGILFASLSNQLCLLFFFM